jgi:pimeloyl-ACP methyl ester carboxylesterase
MRVRGADLHVEVLGTGPAILLVHGAGESSALFGPAPRRLARLGRVIAYDRRGNGRSGGTPAQVADHVEDAAALLAALDPHPAVVVGRSHGGVIACALALRHPDAVRALVLLDPAAMSLLPAAAAWQRGLAERVRAERDTDAGERFGREVLGAAEWQRLPESMRAVLRSAGPALRVETGDEEPQLRAEDLARLRAPTLVVTGRDSPPVFGAVAAAVAHAVPGAELAVVAGGHAVSPAAPAVRRWIAVHPPGPTRSTARSAGGGQWPAASQSVPTPTETSSDTESG